MLAGFYYRVVVVAVKGVVNRVVKSFGWQEGAVDYLSGLYMMCFSVSGEGLVHQGAKSPKTTTPRTKSSARSLSADWVVKCQCQVWALNT